MSSRLPLAATTFALAVITLAACSQEPATEPAAGPAAAVPSSTAQFGDGPAPEVTATPVATATATTTTTKAAEPAPLLADGRHPSFIKAVGGGVVTMDLVEFLTGDAAAKAWQQKNPDSEQDSPDNDYFIVNDNPKVRKLPLDPSVKVKVVGASGPGAEETIAAGGIEKHFGNLLTGTLFWFTVQQGAVTKIEQQFLP